MITEKQIEEMLGKDSVWDYYLKQEGLTYETALIDILKQNNNYSEENLLQLKKDVNQSRIKAGKKPLFSDV